MVISSSSSDTLVLVLDNWFLFFHDWVCTRILLERRELVHDMDKVRLLSDWFQQRDDNSLVRSSAWSQTGTVEQVLQSLTF